MLTEEWQQKQPLSLRLRQDAEQTEPVPGPLLRKYIAYARTYCHPVLSGKARVVLSDFYLQLRKTQRGGDSVASRSPPRHATHHTLYGACALHAHRMHCTRTACAACAPHARHACTPCPPCMQVPITTRQLESLVRLAEVPS